MKEDIQNDMKMLNANVDQMQVLVIIKKNGMETNVGVNVGN